MASVDKPYKRLGVGDNSWEDLLDQVNEELENPPEDTDCEPIDPIEIPEECHRWAKEDIEEVHDKLKEMPEDCFEFEEIPDLWKISIIEDIENQLGESWCDCENEEICCEPCGNAGSSEENFVKSNTSSACDTPCKSGCPGACEATNCIPQMQITKSHHNDWANAACAFCTLYEEVIELEEELEALEEKKENCPDGETGDQCRADAQEEIDEKQEELDEKTEERDAKGAEKDATFSLYDGMRSQVISCYGDCCRSASPPGSPCINIMSQSGDAIDPGDDEMCEGFFDPCCGCNFTRCRVNFVLQQRITTEFGVGGWNTVYGGSFDKNGNLFITLSKFCCCCCELDFACCCTSNPIPECQPVSCNPGSCSSITIDWRELVFRPPTFTPFDCEDGGPCDGVGGGGGGEEEFI